MKQGRAAILVVLAGAWAVLLLFRPFSLPDWLWWMLLLPALVPLIVVGVGVIGAVVRAFRQGKRFGALVALGSMVVLGNLFLSVVFGWSIPWLVAFLPLIGAGVLRALHMWSARRLGKWFGHSRADAHELAKERSAENDRWAVLKFRDAPNYGVVPEGKVGEVIEGHRADGRNVEPVAVYEAGERVNL